ncbi:MAG: hypothetical protein U0869_09680 [Chloroflexota bacterium]
MPGAYLAFLLLSMAGVGLLAWRFLPGTLSRRLLAPIGAVLVVFLLLFDVAGAARGWFASSTDWVVGLVPPGIPPEEVLLLGFLALFSVVVLRVSRRLLGEEDA